VGDYELAPLYDRAGALGRAFLSALSASNVRETIDHTYLVAVARFNAHKEIDGFENTITYGARALGNHDGVFKESLSQIFNSRNHEGTHAIDFNRCAALHLTGFNPHSRFLLLPEDEIRLMEMKERNAMSRAWLLDRVAAGDLPADNPAALQDALYTHAQTVLENTVLTQGSALDYYRALALLEYEAMVPKRIRQYGDRAVFVTLSDRDWLEIGRSFSVPGVTLSTFGSGPADLARFNGPPLDSALKDCVRTLYAELPLPRDPVPFGSALAACGLTRRRFLAQSLIYRPLIVA
jgi:hypothetical protein